MFLALVEDRMARSAGELRNIFGADTTTERRFASELAALISEQLELAGVAPPLPAEELAATAMAIDEGLVHRRRTDPDAIAPDLLMRTLSLFVTDSSAGHTR